MKQVATMALMLNLGIAGAYAQKSVSMTFQGTAGASTINLNQPSTNNDEDDFAGNGTLGTFTFRNVRAITALPQPPSSTCSGPNQYNFVSVAGAGVFRFNDGSLLIVTLTQGTDCIDLAARMAHCNLTFQITGGTGRFAHASGVLTMNEIVVPVLGDVNGNPVYFAATGGFTGTISGVGTD